MLPERRVLPLDDRAIEAAVEEIAGYLRGEELETTERSFFRDMPEIEDQ